MGRNWYMIKILHRLLSIVQLLYVISVVGDTGYTAQSKNQSHWVKKSSLVDSRTNVTDIKFAPKHMGLLLAVCSADGGVITYTKKFLHRLEIL